MNIQYKKLICGVAVALLLQGCKSANLTEYGKGVTLTNNVAKSCVDLGRVQGTAGGMMGGDMMSNENLKKYARNDLKNKAADKGATHVVVTSEFIGSTEDNDATSTGRIHGVAYKCP